MCKIYVLHLSRCEYFQKWFSVIKPGAKKIPLALIEANTLVRFTTLTLEYYTNNICKRYGHQKLCTCTLVNPGAPLPPILSFSFIAYYILTYERE